MEKPTSAKRKIAVATAVLTLVVVAAVIAAGAYFFSADDEADAKRRQKKTKKRVTNSHSFFCAKRQALRWRRRRDIRSTISCIFRKLLPTAKATACGGLPYPVNASLMTR